MLVEKAESKAKKAHAGRFRKDKTTPEIEHPKKVVEILQSIGITDEHILAAAWLHDTIEDTLVTKEEIEKEFDQKTANLVLQLTRDCSREEYLKRMQNAGYEVQIIKLADVVHNTECLFTGLPEKTIQRLVNDSLNVFIPLAENVNKELKLKLEQNIKPWLAVKTIKND